MWSKRRVAARASLCADTGFAVPPFRGRSKAHWHGHAEQPVCVARSRVEFIWRRRTCSHSRQGDGRSLTMRQSCRPRWIVSAAGQHETLVTMHATVSSISFSWRVVGLSETELVRFYQSSSFRDIGITEPRKTRRTKPRVKQAKPPFCSRKREPTGMSRICESAITTLQNLQPRFKSVRRVQSFRTHLEADSQRETGSGATGPASPISL
jgi:hypothetical protein